MERIYIDAPGEGEFVVPPTSLGLVLVTHEEKSGGVWYQRSSVLIAASAGTVIPYSIDAGRLCFGVGEMESETRLFEYGNPGPGARQDWTVPAYCYDLLIECWGPGGLGGDGGPIGGGGGGGGGSYASRTLAVTPGTQLMVWANTRYAPGGWDACFVQQKVGTEWVRVLDAPHGQPGEPAADGGHGGAGGSPSSLGMIAHAGGAGGDGWVGPTAGGGGGGSAASPGADGLPGVSSVGRPGGTGGQSSGDHSGAGGNGGADGADGNFGLPYGGGGGGGGQKSDRTLGMMNGRSLVRLTWQPRTAG